MHTHMRYASPCRCTVCSIDICVLSRDAEACLWASQQGPNSSEDFKDSKTVPGTASKWWNNLETEQPILWSDEYLPTGGMLIPSVLSQQAHMVPCCRRHQQKCLFSTGCPQFIFAVLCTCCMTIWHLTKRAFPSQNVGGFYLRSSCCWFFLCSCSSHKDTNNTRAP